jgi:hypothetical protein
MFQSLHQLSMLPDYTSLALKSQEVGCPGASSAPSNTTKADLIQYRLLRKPLIYIPFGGKYSERHRISCTSTPDRERREDGGKRIWPYGSQEGGR